MQMGQEQGRVAYEPSSLALETPRESASGGFHTAAVEENGVKGRIRPESFADHYSQARQFYISQSATEQAHMASALVFELSKLEFPHLRLAMLGHLQHIDHDFAQRVATGLGVKVLPPAPSAASAVKKLAPSPALQIIGKMKATLEGRCIGILINEGSDGIRIHDIRKALVKERASFKIIAPTIGEVALADGSIIKVDGQLAGTPSVLFDAVVLVLSEKGAEALIKEAAAIDFVRDAFGHLKTIGVDDGGKILFAATGLQKDIGITELKTLSQFLACAKTRHWQREASVRTLA